MVEELIPTLQQKHKVVLNYRLYSSQLFSTESLTALQADRFKPKLGFRSVPLYMDMCWLAAITRIKEETIWPTAKNRWHSLMLTPSFSACKSNPAILQ